MSCDGKPNPYFGENWGAPVLVDAEQVETPVGESCLFCTEEIEDGDQGFLMPYFSEGGMVVTPVHKECQLRSVLGGLAHQHGVCGCFGEKGTDPAKYLTYREEAIEVWLWVERHGVRTR